MGILARGVRNTFRNTIRTVSIVIILGLSIGLALTMLVAHQAVGTKIDSVKSSIGNTITISPAGERGFEGGGNPLTAAQMTQVKETPHVVALTETLQDRLDSNSTSLQSAIQAGALGRRFGGGGGGGFGGAAAGGTGTAVTFTPPVTVTGTNNLTNTASLGGGGGSVKLISGKSFDPTVDANVALVGKALASKNNLSIGSTFNAYGATITVAGIFDAGNTFSNGALILPLPTEQRLSAQPGDVTSAVAQVDSITNVDSTVTAIQSKLGSAADVTSEQDSSTQALAPLESIQNISLYSVIGAVVAGSVIILLTMMMIVRERRREIGVLKAIGASNFGVTAQFIVEAVTFTLMGAVVGLLIGVAGSNPVTKVLVNSNTSTSVTGGMGRGFGGFGRGGGQVLRAVGFGGNGIRNIQASVGWDILLWGLLAALAIAVIGSAIPAWAISKVRPAEVMRAE